MKIINIENKYTVLYIQVKDLIVINQTNIILPNSIYEKMINKNSDTFIRITDKKEMEFLESIHWIFNYRNFEKSNYKSLIDLERMILAKRNEVIKKLNCSDNQNEELTIKQRILKHQSETIYDIIKYRLGELDIPFPNAPDFFKSPIYIKSKYKLQLSLNPSKMLLSNENNKIIKHISKDTLTSIIKIALMIKNYKDTFYVPIKHISDELTENKRYLIIKMQPYTDYKNIESTPKFIIKKK